MNWNQFIEQFSKGKKLFMEIGKNNVYQLAQRDGKAWMFIRQAGNATPEQCERYVQMLGTGLANNIDAFLTSRVLADGPKIFSPSQLELELMEQIELNLPMSDYVQPFETVVVEFPDSYLSKKSVACPQAGEMQDGQLMPTTHHPGLVILHHRPDMNIIICMCVFSSMQSLKTLIYPKPDEPLEQYVRSLSSNKATIFADADLATEAEYKVCEEALLAAMNYCLLLDEVGTRCLGAHNESYYNRLHRYIEVARKSGNRTKLEAAEDELRSYPIRYEIKQRVKLYATVRTEAELPEGEGRHKVPHRRRGHYRMQRVGPGRAERKRIRIPPVFVNKRFFLGDDSDTEVRYT